MRDRMVRSAVAATDWRLAGGRFHGTPFDSDVIFNAIEGAIFA